MLEEAEYYLNSIPANQSDILLELKKNIAMTYMSLSLFEKALPHLEAVLSMQIINSGEDCVEVLRTQNMLIKLLLEIEDYAKAKAMIQELLNEKFNEYSENDPVKIETLYYHAVTLGYEGKYKEAEEILRRTTALRSRILGEDHLDTLCTKRTLGLILERQLKFRDARKIFDDVLYIAKTKYGLEHPDTIETMKNIAILLKMEGRFSESEIMLREVVKNSTKTLGLNHYRTISAEISLSIVLMNRDNKKEAEEILKSILKRNVNKNGIKHKNILFPKILLAKILAEKGKIQECKNLLIEYHDLIPEDLEDINTKILSTMNEVARVLLNIGELGEAERILTKNISMMVVKNSERFMLDTLIVRNLLTCVLIERGKLEEAEATINENLDISLSILECDHPLTLNFMNTLGSVYARQSRFEEAISVLSDCLEKQKSVLGADHPHSLNTMNNISHVLLKQKEYKHKKNSVND